MALLRIRTQNGGEVKAEINSAIAEDLMPQLPLTTSAKRWGDEIYFTVPVQKPKMPDARDTFKVGEVAYWPEGKALAIFFGPTPASDDTGAPKAVVPVNPIGRIHGDVSELKEVEHGETLKVERA